MTVYEVRHGDFAVMVAACSVEDAAGVGAKALGPECVYKQIGTDDTWDVLTEVVGHGWRRRPVILSRVLMDGLTTDEIRQMIVERSGWIGPRDPWKRPFAGAPYRWALRGES